MAGRPRALRVSEGGQWPPVRQRDGQGGVSQKGKAGAPFGAPASDPTNEPRLGLAAAPQQEQARERQQEPRALRSRAGAASRRERGFPVDRRDYPRGGHRAALLAGRLLRGRGVLSPRVADELREPRAGPVRSRRAAGG